MHRAWRARAPPRLASVSEQRANDTEALKDADLRRMKRLATGLLVVIAAVFVLAYTFQDEYPWLQYVRAAAEGGMVGALADWFAVTALFRRPLGLPIPHTAIIPRKKDQIGASLGAFVGENFLAEPVVRAKLASAHVACRTGTWLAQPAHARRVTAEGAILIRAAITVLDDDAVQGIVESLVRQHLIAPQWGPPAGRLAEKIFAAGGHHGLVDLMVDRASDWLAGNYDVVTRIVGDRAPAWVPRFMDSVVADRVYAELASFLQAVQSDPDHDVRQSVDNYLTDLVRDLQVNPETIGRVERIKTELVDDPRIRDLSVSSWLQIKNALLEAIDNPASSLSLGFERVLRNLGRRLAEDEVFAARVDQWLGDALGHVVRTYRSDMAAIVEETVGRWDGTETSRKIELQIGRDLQFIRLNGTMVGSLAGLSIFALAHAILP